MNRDGTTFKVGGSTIPILWGAASAFGATAGGVLASLTFPDGGFARNPIGEFGWRTVGFALVIGVAFSLCQWGVLYLAGRNYRDTDLLRLLLWIPVTSVGLAALLLPLWWVDAENFLLSSGSLGLAPMFPGMLMLALVQWLLLRWTLTVRWYWVPLTVFGVILGVIFGVPISYILRDIIEPVNPLAAFTWDFLEAQWSFAIGSGIGLCQAVELKRYFQPGSGQNWFSSHFTKKSKEPSADARSRMAYISLICLFFLLFTPFIATFFFLMSAMDQSESAPSIYWAPPLLGASYPAVFLLTLVFGWVFYAMRWYEGTRWIVVLPLAWVVSLIFVLVWRGVVPLTSRGRESYRIVDEGIYQQITSTEFGYIGPPDLIQVTNRIPARSGVLFGVRFRAATAMPQAPKLRITFPTTGAVMDTDRIRLIDGLVNPIETIESKEWLALYRLDDNWQSLPKQMRLEIRYRDDVLAQQDFTLVPD